MTKHIDLDSNYVLSDLSLLFTLRLINISPYDYSLVSNFLFFFPSRVFVDSTVLLASINTPSYDFRCRPSEIWNFMFAIMVGVTSKEDLTIAKEVMCFKLSISL